ncbi:MAG: 30S ribosomal protein S16 [Oscillospiraceae bacterium]|jgi:small subunit ribosomal protein S16|nr:30S ribosomal protein S16 [Oscillospiraceae bacterium]
MVKIRLRRVGCHKRPFYRIVVADSRSPRDGKFIEFLGTYNPILENEKSKIDIEKAQKWIANGAQPTQIVKSIIKNCLQQKV